MGYSDNCHFRNKEIKINEKSSNVYTNFIGLGISIWQSELGKPRIIHRDRIMWKERKVNKDLYKTRKVRMRIKDGVSEEIEIRWGVRQELLSVPDVVHRGCWKK